MTLLMRYAAGRSLYSFGTAAKPAGFWLGTRRLQEAPLASSFRVWQSYSSAGAAYWRERVTDELVSLNGVVELENYDPQDLVHADLLRDYEIAAGGQEC